MEYQEIIDAVYAELAVLHDPGEVASYIPELGIINPNKFGVQLTTISGNTFACGDAAERFSIQSIAKVLSLVLAYRIEEEDLWKRVGVEPSGTSFNSLIQLESDNGIPRNPLINSGALVVCDVLCSHLKNPKEEFLTFIRDLSGIQGIKFNERVANSEKKFGFRNAALVNLMKAFGNIENDVEMVLDFYFHLCSIEMSCAELSKTFLLFANKGKQNSTGLQVVKPEKVKRINAIMQTCGFYDEAGDFAFKVGLPGKSGVGGGIVAVLPEEYAIAIWSPRLNKKGNSFKGMEFLERFTTLTNHSIF